MNKYQYSYNNPLRYVDPDGHEAEDAADQDPQQDPKPAPPPRPYGPQPGDDIRTYERMQTNELNYQCQQSGMCTNVQVGPITRDPDYVVGAVITVTQGAVKQTQDDRDKVIKEAPGKTASGHPTDKNGRPLGPSGKPMIHNPRFPNRKDAKDAARRAGQGAPMKHPNPMRGDPHFHPTKRGGKKKQDGTHYNYPGKGYPKKAKRQDD